MNVETKAARIKSAKHTGGLRIRVRWMNAHVDHVVDLAPIVTKIKGLRPIRDERRFAKVAVGEGGHSLVWPGDLDIGADRLFALDLEQNGKPGSAEFFEWRQRHSLSLARAAEALSISRRMVAYYSSGKTAVPRSITLACQGWEFAEMTARLRKSNRLFVMRDNSGHIVWREAEQRRRG